MKFLCLAYYDEKKFDAMSKAELAALVARCKAHDEALHRGGRVSMISSLAAPANSMCVRPRNGRPTVTDGPYAEAKESLAGWWIIDAEEARAIDIASRCVAFTGGPVEVRQVADAPPEV